MLVHSNKTYFTCVIIFWSQADVEVIFSFSSLTNAEKFYLSWDNAQNLCAQKGSQVQGGIGPFGLLTLASEKLEEFTPVFFRIFRAQSKNVVLLCSDASRFVLLLIQLL